MHLTFYFRSANCVIFTAAMRYDTYLDHLKTAFFTDTIAVPSEAKTNTTRF